MIWVSDGYIEVTEIFGFPVYTLYPGSMIIFGVFGSFLALKDQYKGLLAVMSAAAFYDFIGILTAGMRPASWLFVVHFAIISLAFIANRKSLFRFIWSAPFMFFIIVMLTGSPWLYWIQYPWAEPLEELVWCGCFYLAFYGSGKQKVADRHEKEIADIEYHPDPPKSEMLP